MTARTPLSYGGWCWKRFAGIAWLASALFISAEAPARAEEEAAPTAKPAPADISASIKRGLDFLVANQNKDGSWGDHTLAHEGSVTAAVPGAFHAFRAGSTSICIMGMIEARDGRPEVDRAIERGEKWLMTNLPKLRRCELGELYNIWGHAYGIRALVRMHNRLEANDPQRAEIVKVIKQQVDLLDRFSAVDGGWGYYNFGFATKQPSGDPPSFTTATVLVALHEAKALGVELPERTVKKALICLNRQRLPGFTYTYSLGHTRAPVNPIHWLPGSLGRTQVCNLALRLYGNEKVTDEVLGTWLENLLKHNFWLSRGRKTLQPHESYAQVAGYFFYYGHFYAAQCLELLPKEEQTKYNERLAALIASLQDKDGSWFDFPLYNYHQYYGTGYALSTLVRCK